MSDDSCEEDNIRVTVRVRPPIRFEEGSASVVRVSGQQLAIDIELHRELGEKGETRNFIFDDCFDALVDQSVVYERTGAKILKNALEGYNGCLFAYGQTGSGKTFTLYGTQAQSGVVPRLCRDLFDEGKLRTSDRDIRVVASYLEIYNNRIHDLLSPNEDSAEPIVLQHPKHGVTVRNLTESAVSSFADVQDLLNVGNRKRACAATNINSHSSRSHSVFSLHLVTHDKTQIPTVDPCAVRRDRRSTPVPKEAVMNLVDLAGSERTKKAGTYGSRQVEGIHINSSLMVLSQVIFKLASEKGKGHLHVPFRQSKLTHLLQNSLAGNSRTFMVANISPSAVNAEETLSTLRFASSVKCVRTSAHVNVVSTHPEVDMVPHEQSVLRSTMEPAYMPSELSTGLMKPRYVWDRVLRQSKQQVQEQMGSVVRREGDLRPYLLNISDDPSLAGCLTYALEGTVTVGSAVESTVRLRGLGITSNHCLFFVNPNNVDVELVVGDHQFSRKSSLPGPSGRVTVNGKVLAHGRKTCYHGDTLVLGRAFCFRLIVPRDAAVGEDGAMQVEGIPFGNTGECGAVLGDVENNDSVTLSDDVDWKLLNKFFEAEFGGVDFVNQLQEVAHLIDEANEITVEVMGSEEASCELHFGVCAVLPLNKGKGACAVGVQLSRSGEPLVTWDLARFRRRLAALRDVYQAYTEVGDDWQQMCMWNPWEDPEPADLALRMEGIREDVWRQAAQSVDAEGASQRVHRELEAFPYRCRSQSVCDVPTPQHDRERATFKLHEQFQNEAEQAARRAAQLRQGNTRVVRTMQTVGSPVMHQGLPVRSSSPQRIVRQDDPRTRSFSPPPAMTPPAPVTPRTSITPRAASPAPQIGLSGGYGVPTVGVPNAAARRAAERHAERIRSCQSPSPTRRASPPSSPLYSQFMSAASPTPSMRSNIRVPIRGGTRRAANAPSIRPGVKANYVPSGAMERVICGRQSHS